jgi:hypothetical protein
MRSCVIRGDRAKRRAVANELDLPGQHCRACLSIRWLQVALHRRQGLPTAEPLDVRDRDATPDGQGCACMLQRMRALLGLREPASFGKRPEFAIEILPVVAEQPGVPAGQERRQKFFLLRCEWMLPALRTLAAVEGDVAVCEVPGREVAALRCTQAVVGAQKDHHAELRVGLAGLDNPVQFFLSQCFGLNLRAPHTVLHVHYVILSSMT